MRIHFVHAHESSKMKSVLEFHRMSLKVSFIQVMVICEGPAESQLDCFTCTATGRSPNRLSSHLAVRTE